MAFKKNTSTIFSVPDPSPDPDEVHSLNQTIYKFFLSADRSKNGSLDFRELCAALRNDRKNSFKPETCRLMIMIFDAQGDGVIDAYEFERLWNYLAQWRMCFNELDSDNSGNIGEDELSKGLRSMGYKLSRSFISVVFKKLDHEKLGHLRFDDFIRFMCILNSLTQQWRGADRCGVGKAEVSYEQFLSMSFRGAV